MTFLKRLRVLPAVLGVAAAPAAVGTTLFGDFRAGAGRRRPGRPDAAPTAAGRRGAGRHQVQQAPRAHLPARAAATCCSPGRSSRPLDAGPGPARATSSCVVDTSASQAGKPLQQARQIVTALAAGLDAGRPRERVGGQHPGRHPAAHQRLPAGRLRATCGTPPPPLTEVEYGSGATDLKGGLSKALATIAPNRGRHQVVLFLGDGESAYNPVTEADRIALGSRMDRDRRLLLRRPARAEGELRTTCTGSPPSPAGPSSACRKTWPTRPTRAEFVARLKAALDVPVVKAETVQVRRRGRRGVPDQAAAAPGRQADPGDGQARQAGRRRVTATVNGHGRRPAGRP